MYCIDILSMKKYIKLFDKTVNCIIQIMKLNKNMFVFCAFHNSCVYFDEIFNSLESIGILHIFIFAIFCQLSRLKLNTFSEDKWSLSWKL